MTLRSGNAASFLVEFPSGVPDGNITWNVLGPDGVALHSGTVTVPADAVSLNIAVPAAFNTLAPDQLISFRDVTWSYTVNGEVINGESRYRIEGRVPYGATVNGVRNKLGLERHDVPDDQIDLVKAYYDFLGLVGDVADTYTDAEQLYIANAIEALAALAILPSLQVSVALQESSGTDSFKRQAIDWAALADGLNAIVVEGALIVFPAFDPTTGFGSIFILASPSADAITGG